MNEVGYLLVGQRRGRIWHGRLVRRVEGGPASVELDWAVILEREERRGDVLGFYHSHPPGAEAPSERDVRTMRAWMSCLGKPLLCVIESGPALRGYLFATDKDPGTPLAEVQRFPRNVIIGVGDRGYLQGWTGFTG